MTVGMYELHVMEPIYNIPLHDKLIYFYLAISEQCTRGSGMKIYFQTVTSKRNHAYYFKFSEEKHHYIWFDYGITSVLYFYLERYLVPCTTYVEFTSSPYRLKFPYRRKIFFKVSIHHRKANFNFTCPYPIPKLNPLWSGLFNGRYGPGGAHNYAPPPPGPDRVKEIHKVISFTLM